MSLTIKKDKNLQHMKQLYAANQYTFREGFRMAVVCRSIPLSEIPSSDHLQFLRSCLMSELAPQSAPILEEKLYAILYSKQLSFSYCSFKVNNNWFTNADTGCMVTLHTMRVNDQLLIAAASCEVTQEQNSFRFLTKVFGNVVDLTANDLKNLLLAICFDEMEVKKRQENLDYINFIEGP
jgi:hypothetical protein